MLGRLGTTQCKFIAVMMPMIIAGTVLAALISITIEQRNLQRQLVEEMRSIAETQALAMRIPVWSFDSQALQSVAEAILTNASISVVAVLDHRGVDLARAERPRTSRHDSWTIATPVLAPYTNGRDEVIGHLKLTYHDAGIRQDVQDRLVGDGLLLLALFIGMSGSAIVAHTLIIGQPLHRFLAAIHRAEDPRLRQPIPITSRDEIAQIMAAYNRLLARLAVEESERTRAADALRAARDRAERALDDLRQTQHSLIQAEKMASLGQMVAGVAHEINTPIGIALTAATHLEQETRTMRAAVEANAIRRSHLLNYLGTTDESARLLHANMLRAAELIQSFKQVAVDRSHDERRPFDLRGYVEEVILSLGPRLKKTPHTVRVQGPDHLPVLSFPGAVAQMLSNIILNALVHAFAPDQAGSITITLAQAPDDQVLLQVRDDGRGIPPEHLDRIFEPFFTTGRSVGGSGLGLHICFNLVTRTLGGRLTVESAVGRGTCFTARFPREAPETTDGDPALAAD